VGEAERERLAPPRRALGGGRLPIERRAEAGGQLLHSARARSALRGRDNLQQGAPQEALPGGAVGRQRLRVHICHAHDAVRRPRREGPALGSLFGSRVHHACVPPLLLGTEGAPRVVRKRGGDLRADLGEFMGSSAGRAPRSIGALRLSAHIDLPAPCDLQSSSYSNSYSSSNSFSNSYSPTAEPTMVTSKNITRAAASSTWFLLK